MPYLVQIVSAIVTALIGYIAKRSDICLDKIFGKVGALISNKIGNTAAIIVQTNPCVAIEFDKGNNNIIKKIADEHGYAEFKKDLNKGDTILISAYGVGYIQEDAQITIDNENVTYCVVLKLRKRRGSKKGS